MDKYIGKLLDNRYEILEVIGTGGMAVVYKARCRVLNRFVAIKILKDEFSQDAEFRRRFYNESQAVAKLSHNNIVSIYDVSHTDGVEYIVMELIEGITLKEYLQKKGKLSWQESLYFAQQIARALNHAHSRGIIHQDIKPHNIILLRDGTAKVTDFGIARFAANQETKVVQEAIGSVHYISPEQAKGSTIDYRTDIYSLGVVMYEMLTGRLPFEGDTPLAIVMQHINAIPLMPSALSPEVPPAMDEIVMRAMSPTLSKRYASAQELYNDLEQIKHDPNIEFRYGKDSGRGDSAGNMEATRPIKYRPNEAAPFPHPEPPASRQRKVGVMEQIASPITVVVVVVLLFVAAAFFLVKSLLFSDVQKPQTVLVPKFIDQMETDIEKNLTYQSQFTFQVNTKQVEGGTEGKIIEQEPGEGEEVEIGSLITLTVTTVPVEEEKELIVPSLDGYKYVDAYSKLISEAGFSRDNIDRVEEASEEVPEGLVIRTEPGRGETLPVDGKLKVFVSIGEDKVTKVPSLANMTQEQAKQALKDAGLEIGEVTTEESDKTEGTIIKQNPVKGVEAEKGTKVDITLAKPKAEEDPEPPQPEAPPAPPEEEKPKTAQIPVKLPSTETMDEAQVVIKTASGQIVHQQSYKTSLGIVYIPVEGTGSQLYKVSVQGMNDSEYLVNFNDVS